MISVAILGFGTVGSGVAEVLSVNADKIAQSAASEIALKYIVDVRDFPDSPFAGLFVKDFSVVENDPDVKIVVETIGGVGIAYEFTKRSLLAGKSVVTSNKELVATHGYELVEIARDKNVNYLFEASVGGGIPIIRPISQCLAANRISEIYGILNGTTNYILTQMFKNGIAFETALAEAQQMGYAERDPRADIDGHDACRKICILSDLCFGHNIDPVKVPTEGITSVTSEDVLFAGKCGYKIKLIGRAVADEDDRVYVYVAPHLVSETNLIAEVEGVMNGIVVNGNAIGNVMFYGAGAGKLPTASAVVADVIDSAKHILRRRLIGWDEGGERFTGDAGRLKTRWYLRTEKGALKKSGLQLVGSGEKCEAYFTGEMDREAVMHLTEGMKTLSMFRILD